MDVQIGQLRAFLAVAESRHFTRAARELGIAQPSVSAHVRRLESDLGTELFHRTKGKVSLTPGGETLLPFARRVIADVDAAAADLRSVPLVMFREGYDLRASTEAACRAAGFAPTFAVEGGEMDGVLRLTAAGLGAAIVPSLVIEPHGPLKAVRIAGSALTRTVGLANRRDRRLSRAGQELVETVRALVRDRSWLKTSPRGLTVLR